jgi:DHA3 family tetracycline resistance protein-like MFS transporter
MNGARTVRGSRTLQALFFAMLLGSAFADGFYKFSRAHILLSFDLPTITLPVLGVLKDNLWLGLLEMLQGLFYLAGAEVVRRKIHLERAGTSARTLMVFYSLMLAALFVFAITGRIGLAMAAWVIVCGLQDLGEPIMEAWLNQNIPSKVRATVISMSSQTGEIGALGSSTGMGAFGDHFGVRSALKLLGVILLPLILIYRQNAKGLPIGASDAEAQA